MGILDTLLKSVNDVKAVYADIDSAKAKAVAYFETEGFKKDENNQDCLKLKVASKTPFCVFLNEKEVIFQRNSNPKEQTPISYETFL